MTTYRLIIHKEHKTFPSLSDYKQYNYIHYRDFACIEIPEDTFFFIKIKHQVEIRNGIPEYADMPTYAIVGR